MPINGGGTPLNKGQNLPQKSESTPTRGRGLPQNVGQSQQGGEGEAPKCAAPQRHPPFFVVINTECNPLQSVFVDYIQAKCEKFVTFVSCV